MYKDHIQKEIKNNDYNTKEIAKLKQEIQQQKDQYKELKKEFNELFFKECNQMKIITEKDK